MRRSRSVCSNSKRASTFKKPAKAGDQPQVTTEGLDTREEEAQPPSFLVELHATCAKEVADDTARRRAAVAPCLCPCTTHFFFSPYALPPALTLCTVMADRATRAVDDDDVDMAVVAPSSVVDARVPPDAWLSDSTATQRSEVRDARKPPSR